MLVVKPVRKRLNTKDFIERANITHNNKYDESHHWEYPDAKSRDVIKNALAKKYNYKLARIPESKYYELDKYIPYTISVCGKYYVNGNFYMTVSELCKYENIKHTGDIKDYDQYLVYKK